MRGKKKGGGLACSLVDLELLTDQSVKIQKKEQYRPKQHHPRQTSPNGTRPTAHPPAAPSTPLLKDPQRHVNNEEEKAMRRAGKIRGTKDL